MNKTEYIKKLHLARNFLSENNFTEAKKHLAELNSQFPENEEVMIFYACSLLETGNPVEAFELANQAVELRPDLMYLKKIRGQLFAKMGVNDGAASDLEEYSLRLANELKTAKLNLLRVKAASGKLEEALIEADSLYQQNKWSELEALKKLLLFVDKIVNQRKQISQGIADKLLLEARKGLDLEEYWYSKLLAETLLNDTRAEKRQRMEAVLLLMESFISTFQFKPAKELAEKYGIALKNNPAYEYLLNKIDNYKIETDEISVLHEINNKHNEIKTDFFYPADKLEVISTKFFDVAEDSKSEKRKYYSQFSIYKTKYIGMEIIFRNLLFKKKKSQYKGYSAWYMNDFEIGRSYFKLNINENWDSVIYVQTWGSDEHMYWENGQGKVEIYIEDFKVSESYFRTGNDPLLIEVKKGIKQPEIGENDQHTSQQEQKKRLSDVSLEKLLEELNGYVGLSNIKNSIQDFIDYLEFLKERQKLGLKVQEGISINSVFLGNPGTGKTTIARLMARIYYAMGLLKEYKLIEVDRAALVGQYIGETAQKTEKIIENAMGGVLFIDEAYSLVKKGSNQDFGQEAIDILLKRMEDHKGQFAVIVAGYPDEMEEFLESNPGMKSRFSHTFMFEDYSPSELVRIINNMANNEDYSLTDETKEILEKELNSIYRNRDKTFGNARLARKIFDGAKLQVSKRYLNSSKEIKDKELLSRIIPEDIYEILKPESVKTVNLPIDQEALNAVLDEINSLTGLENVKKEVSDIVKLARFYIERGENIKAKFSSHILFLGNPGTGKTTVARLFSRVYSALGILEKGHLIEVDREGIVSGFAGQTAIKTRNIINRSLGGTLFIDEAYSLTGSSNDSFGLEAIDVLLKRMEDDRGRFIVIAAGYTEEMKRFIGSNPGLKSRFNKTIYFDDYKTAELLKIAENIFRENNLKYGNDVLELLQKYFELLYSKRDARFGNARVVRTICEEIKNQVHLRYSEKQEKSEDVLISTEDVKKLFSGENLSFLEKKDDLPGKIDDLIEEIRLLPGLNNVKRSIDKLISGIRISEIRKQKGLGVFPKPFHCVFSGNHGTGKTTIASYIGSILKEMNYLSTGKVFKINHFEIMDNEKKIDHSKLKSLLASTKGSVLYLQDAGSYTGFTDNILQELFRSVFKIIELNNSDNLVIVSGKQEDIQNLMSRITSFSHFFSNYFTFSDYSPRELIEITAYVAAANGFIMDEGALQQLFELFIDVYNYRDENFTNAFLCQKVLHQAIANQEERISGLKKHNDEELNLITLEDIRGIKL